MSWPMALAAGLLLALVSALSIWTVLGYRQPAMDLAATPDPLLQPVSVSSLPYGQAVEDLLEVLDTRRSRLNPRTVQVIEGSLATIDRAIAEATAALAQDPNDVALASHVASQRQLKLAVLRQVEKLTVQEP